MPGFAEVERLAKGAKWSRAPQRVDLSREGGVKAAASKVKDGDADSFMRGDSNAGTAAWASLKSFADSITDSDGTPLKEAVKTIVATDFAVRNVDIATPQGKAKVVNLMLTKALGGGDEGAVRRPCSVCPKISAKRSHWLMQRSPRQRTETGAACSPEEVEQIRRNFNMSAFALRTLMPDLTALVMSMPTSDHKKHWMEIKNLCNSACNGAVEKTKEPELVAVIKKWGPIYQSFMEKAAERGTELMAA